MAALGCQASSDHSDGASGGKLSDSAAREIAMTRNRDRLIDKKIGSVIRMQRVKLRVSQSDLGNSLGVTFQQIQKYENGGNAVASTRIPALCQTLEISPNDLFGVSELSQLDS